MARAQTNTIKSLRNLSSNLRDVIEIEFCDKDDDQTVGHLVFGHVLEHRLKRRLEVTLKEINLFFTPYIESKQTKPT
jgi:hypothetical protein